MTLYTCPNCGRKTRGYRLNNESPLLCSFCLKVERTRLRDLIEPSPYYCDNCGKKIFAYLWNRNHGYCVACFEIINSKPRCPKCGLVGGVRRVERSYMTEDNEIKWHCKNCKSSFINKIQEGRNFQKWRAENNV